MACTIGVIWCVLIRGSVGAAMASQQAAHRAFGDAELAGQFGRIGTVEFLPDLRQQRIRL